MLVAVDKFLFFTDTKIVNSKCDSEDTIVVDVIVDSFVINFVDRVSRR